MASDIVLIYATAPDKAVAETIASVLLEQRLIACANILPAITSMYRWQGKVTRDSEVVLILKTQAALAERVIAAGRAAHPYEIPAFVILPVSGGLPAFLEWVRVESSTAQQ